MSLSSKKKTFYAFSALFSLTLFLTGRDRITEIISGSIKEKVQLPVLLKEFAALPIHMGDRRPEIPDAFDKGVIVGVTTHLFSSMPPKDVLSYYLQVLPPQGWEPLRNGEPTQGRKLKFCKDGVSLIIDASTDNVGTNYYLGLVWTASRHSSAYCTT